MRTRKMARRSFGGALVGIALSLACGDATAPSPVPMPTASGVWAADIEPVTQGIVQELRGLGLNVVMAERLPAGIFSVGNQRIDIPSIADESIWVYVYRTAASALSEASRLTPDGNLAPEPGQPPRSRATYITRMHFHNRDRVIAVYGGCDTAFTKAMVTLFGPPLVIADGVRPCGPP